MNPRLIGAIVAVAGVILAFSASAVRPEVEEAEQLNEDLPLLLAALAQPKASGGGGG